MGRNLGRQLVAVHAHITIGQKSRERLQAASAISYKPKRGTNKKF